MSSQLQQSILTLLGQSNGIKASEIAQRLNLNKDSIVKILTNELKDVCYQDTTYKWYLKTQKNPNITKVENADESLSNLCKYYLNCLNIENNNSVSEFLISKYSLKYAELKNLNLSDKKNNQALEFLHKKMSGPNKNVVAYVGYPVMIKKIYSSKNNDLYFKVIPVLLFPIEYITGEINVSNVPSINREIIKQYSTQSSEDNITYEMVELEEQLGFNIADNIIELDELVARLQQLKQWIWKDNINPNEIISEPSIQTLVDDGIYNRAIVVVKEKPHFTVGLEHELSMLSKLTIKDYEKTALYNWINSNNNISKINGNSINNILEVLSLNLEQRLAVDISLKSDITVVSGPPGTGKSQTVTNLLVNAMWNGQKVLFTSKNNKAVNVVETRLNNLSSRPAMLRISASQNYKNLASVIEGLLTNVTNDEQDQVDYANLYESYLNHINICNELENEKKSYISLRNEIDQLEEKISSHREYWQNYYQSITKEEIDELNRTFLKCSKNFFKTIKEKQNLLTRIFWFVFKNSRQKNLNESILSFNKLIEQYNNIEKLPFNLDQTIFDNYSLKFKVSIENMYNVLKYKKLLEIFNDKKTLEDIDYKLFEYKNSLSEISLNLWNKWLLTRQINILPQERRNLVRFFSMLKLQEEDIKNNLGYNLSYRKELTNMYDLIAKFSPCLAITSLSVKGRIPFIPAIYDLLIIDEASQCDIASILPLLYRTKKVVVIGDNKQLSHISCISRKQDISLLQKYDINYEWSYSVNSIFDLANSINNVSSVSLLDHFRSFTDIIEFSNKEFYGSKLRIATDYKKLKLPKDDTAGIKWINIKGKVLRPDNNRGIYNNSEIVEIIKELTRLVIINDYQGNIGIVTPFRAQANKIREEINKIPELSSKLYLKNNFLVDTVHGFQGDEKDIIIFSPVISLNTKDGAIKFLNNTGNLFNVAITRAKSILIVIGDIDYCSNCGVPYMEHFVNYFKSLENKNLSQKNEVFYSKTREYPNIQNIEQVSDWEKYLYTKLFDAGIKTIPQYPVDKYKLDLAIIIDEKKKLDIEVDGEMYHKDWTGELCHRDQLRNQRLFELGWDVKRFWVYQIRDQLSWCIEQIRQWLE